MFPILPRRKSTRSKRAGSLFRRLRLGLIFGKRIRDVELDAGIGAELVVQTELGLVLRQVAAFPRVELRLQRQQELLSGDGRVVVVQVEIDLLDGKIRR